jgi:hypothetical protein
MTKSFTAKVLAVATLTSAMLFAPLQASAAQGGATPTPTPTTGGGGLGGKNGLGGGINCFANPVGVDPVTGATIFVTHCVKFP